MLAVTMARLGGAEVDGRALAGHVAITIFLCGATVPEVTNINCSWPDSTSVRAGALPL